MKRFQLVTRSLVYHWRTSLAVIAGVVAGTAVIGGALIVGDSVRGSLQQMTLDRLGGIDHVLASQRLFTEELAERLAGQEQFAPRFSQVAPALVLQATLERATSGTEADGDSTNELQRAGKVKLYAVDERFWKLFAPDTQPEIEPGQVILNRRVAQQLGAAAGETITVRVEQPSAIPRDTLLGKTQEASVDLNPVVVTVLPEGSGPGRLDLNPNQQLPLVAFMRLDELQDALEISEVRRTRRNPTGRKAQVNTLFISASGQADSRGETAAEAAAALNSLLQRALTLEDAGLRVVTSEKFRYLSLESEQQILGDVFATAGRSAAKQLGLETSPVLVYLANELRNASLQSTEGEEAPVSKYSVVAGVDLSSNPPFGPLPFAGEPPALPLKPASLAKSPAAGDQPVSEGGTLQEGQTPERHLTPEGGPVVINDWLARDLQLEIGDWLLVKYFPVGSNGHGEELERVFHVRGIVEMEDADREPTRAADRGLTPEVKGITDAENFDDWEQPFPMKLPVPQRDDEYWGAYRATPKVFLPLSTAQNLWSSRYGSLTSLRVAVPEEDDLPKLRGLFIDSLLEGIDLEAAGLTFQPVKAHGLQAASGTTDFAGLFLGFSFFLILSAMILIGLLFRLGLERRGRSIGLLTAVGFSEKQVQRLFLQEGMLLVLCGAALGTVAAVGYARLMVYGLKTWWIGAIGTRFLEVFIVPQRLALGAAISVVVAGGAVVWALRELKKLSPRNLLSGAVQLELTATQQHQRQSRAGRRGVVCLIAAAVLLAGVLSGLIPAAQAFAGLTWPVVVFFLVGMLLLAASLLLLSAWLDSDHAAAVRGRGLAGTGRLGLRNASRHRQRSVLTVALIASATFVIVAVAAGRRNPAVELPDRNSGNGGFTLVAETGVKPLPFDPDTPLGREQLGLTFREDVASPAAAARAKQNNALLQQTRIVPFRIKPGENASCLNIYQTRLPTVLGATEEMIERGGFRFVGAADDSPWKLIRARFDRDGIPEYPVLGDMNTLQYSLHKAVGDAISIPDDDNPRYRLRIVGMYDSSIFQGVLVTSAENFERLYPEQAGFGWFLIDVPPDEAAAAARLLETRLTDYGFDTDRVADRLAAFLAVQNTYLATFQTLGGLGLLLGTLGLATVMLRNVLERRSELALLQAVGFRRSGLIWLVMVENALLLLWGLTAGTLSALLAMMPHLRQTGADIPWAGGGLLLTAVFALGMAAAILAVVEAIRTPVVATLRAE